MRYFWMILMVTTMVGCGAVYEKEADRTEQGCPSGYQRCDGACVSLTSNSHCGKCGEACADNASCFKDDKGNYTCRCAAGYETCASEECAVEVATDISHCGGCFNKCGQDEECVGGECVCSSLTRENKVIASDADRAQAYAGELENCGQCGYDCKAVSVDNTRCVEGRCVCDGGGDQLMTSCPDIAEPCSVDLNSDPQNCGKCGNVCEMGTMCTNGDCLCNSGEVYCDGACVDSINEHCGEDCFKCSQNSLCDPATDECVCLGLGNKACLIGGNAYGCVELGTDQNCGDCGDVCMGGKSCEGGECKCPEGFEECGAFKTCVDTQTDPKHCGVCGNSCPVDKPNCEEGACQPCAPNQIDCGNGKCILRIFSGNAICQACGIGHHGTENGEIVEGCADDQQCRWNDNTRQYACFCDDHACQPHSLGCRKRGSLGSTLITCQCEYLVKEKNPCLKSLYTFPFSEEFMTLPEGGDSCDNSGKCSCLGTQNLCDEEAGYCIGDAIGPCLNCPEYDNCLHDSDPFICLQNLCTGGTVSCMNGICESLK